MSSRFENCKSTYEILNQGIFDRADIQPPNSVVTWNIVPREARSSLLANTRENTHRQTEAKRMMEVRPGRRALLDRLANLQYQALEEAYELVYDNQLVPTITIPEEERSATGHSEISYIQLIHLPSIRIP